MSLIAFDPFGLHTSLGSLSPLKSRLIGLDPSKVSTRVLPAPDVLEDFNKMTEQMFGPDLLTSWGFNKLLRRPLTDSSADTAPETDKETQLSKTQNDDASTVTKADNFKVAISPLTSMFGPMSLFESLIGPGPSSMFSKLGDQLEKEFEGGEATEFTAKHDDGGETHGFEQTVGTPDGPFHGYRSCTVSRFPGFTMSSKAQTATTRSTGPDDEAAKSEDSGELPKTTAESVPSTVDGSKV